jgi:hypothetical protein
MTSWPSPTVGFRVSQPAIRRGAASGGCCEAQAVKSCQIAQWRATVDESGQYCFAVAL